LDGQVADAPVGAHLHVALEVANHFGAQHRAHRRLLRESSRADEQLFPTDIAEERNRSDLAEKKGRAGAARKEGCATWAKAARSAKAAGDDREHRAGPLPGLYSN